MEKALVTQQIVRHVPIFNGTERQECTAVRSSFEKRRKRNLICRSSNAIHHSPVFFHAFSIYCIKHCVSHTNSRQIQSLQHVRHSNHLCKRLHPCKDNQEQEEKEKIKSSARYGNAHNQNLAWRTFLSDVVFWNVDGNYARVAFKSSAKAFQSKLIQSCICHIQRSDACADLDHIKKLRKVTRNWISFVLKEIWNDEQLNIEKRTCPSGTYSKKFSALEIIVCNIHFCLGKLVDDTCKKRHKLKSRFRIACHAR